MTNPILYYFDIPGRAEPIRLAFHAAKIPFEDKRFNHEEFAKTYKQMSPSGQVPFLQIGDQKLTETYAILNYVAILGNLLPKDPLHQAKIWEIYMIFEALFHSLMKLRKKEATLEDIQEEIHSKATRIDKLIAENQDKEGHTIGGMLTPVDLMIVCYFDYMQTVGIKLGDTCPHTAKVSEMVKKHPNLQDYFKSRSA